MEGDGEKLQSVVQQPIERLDDILDRHSLRREGNPGQQAGARQDAVRPGNTGGRGIERRADPAQRARIGGGERHRSEEHTSELQSLMRTSYAVLCWKKKRR